MADATLLEYFQELVESYDSTITTTGGSSFRTRIIDPFLERIGDSPLDGDLETFLAERIKEEVPDLDTGENSGIRDLVIRPMSIMLAPLRREINAIKLGQSLNDYNLMTRAELNSLLGNFFLSIQDGKRATGTARLYYSTPQTAVVSTLTKFMTEDALVFYPSSVVSVTAVDMAFSQEGEYYYLDVAVQAAETGETYNIPSGSITQVDGIIGPVYTTNKLAFTSAADDETKEEAVARAQESITIRNLSTSRGVKTLVTSEYPALDVIEVVGFGDSDMLRDVVTGPTNVSGVPGGFTGEKNPDIPSSSIHIGGKTDVYIFQKSPVAASLDITNITDVGKQIVRSESGYTSATSTATFSDSRGYFISNEVEAGDYLRIGQIEAIIASRDSESQITVGAYTNPDGTPVSTLPEGLFNQFYEIVRYDRLKIRVPLFDLVALDSDAAAIIDDDGNYVAPIPGDDAMSALTDADGDYVAKEVNVGASNISLPMVRPKSVGFLHPTSLESTGAYIPLGDILLIKALEDFTSGGGTVRAYFLEAVSCALTAGSYGNYPLFSSETFTYRWGESWGRPEVVRASDSSEPGNGYLEVTTAQYGSSGGTNTINLHYNAALSTQTGGTTPVAGDFLVFHAVNPSDGSGGGSGTSDISAGHDGGPLLITSISVASESDSLELTLRHDGAAGTYAITADSAGKLFGFEIIRGVSYSDTHTAYMAQDTTTGLYYMDFKVVQDSAETENNLSKGDILTLGLPTTGADNDFWVEGYRLRSDALGTAYSVREKPYIELTPYVLGSNLKKTSTAYAVRFTYFYADTLGLVQDFIDDDDNRIVAEDVLVKHFLPGVVQGSIAASGVDDATGLLALQEAITDIAPTEDLELSDLVGVLYTAEATHVTFPIYLSVIHHGQDRTVTASIVSDLETAHKIQKFLPDADLFTYTEIS